MQIRVYNDKTNIFGQKKPVIARRGFFYQDFHLLLTIIDPNGVPVAKIRPESLIEPAPPYRHGERFIVPVEIIPPDGENVWVMNDVRQILPSERYRRLVHGRCAGLAGNLLPI